MFASAATCDRQATSLNQLNVEFAAAIPGETICLATGDYGTWTGGDKAVTITAAEGAAPVMALAFTTGDHSFTIDGISVAGASVLDGAHDITIKNSNVTANMVLHNLDESNIVLDNNTHLNIDGCNGCYGGRIYIGGSDLMQPSGVTIQNSLFRGGSSRAIQTLVQAVIKNNEFDGVHAIALEYSAYGAHVTGNYIHGASTGIVAYNGLSHTLIENNVIITRGRGAGIEIGADNSSVIRHNTLPNPPGCNNGGDCGHIWITGHPGYGPGSGTVVKDNIMTALYVAPDASLAERTNNLMLSGPGVDDTIGTPRYEGAPNPTSFKGYTSTDSSPSRHAASDGSDIGINLASAFTDTENPSVSITNLQEGDTVSGVVTLRATASDDVGINDVSFLYDDEVIGSSDTLAPFTASWNTHAIPDGTYTVTANVRDTSDKRTISTGINVTVDNSSVEPARSVWLSTDSPTVPSQNDASAVELGMRFQSDIDGTIDGVRFYKGAGNTGTHIGNLWSKDGENMASVTFTNETSAGWQEALFDEPVEIEADEIYVVSYYAPNGRYAVDLSYFNNQDKYNYPLKAPASSAGGLNGLFKYGSGGGFPDQSYSASNYWVDVVFSPPPDLTPPTVTLESPTNGSIVQGVVAIEADADDNKKVSGVQFKLDGVHLGAEDTTSPYVVAWDTETVDDGEYVLSAVARDAAGNMTSSSDILVTVKNTIPVPEDPDDPDNPDENLPPEQPQQPPTSNPAQSPGQRPETKKPSASSARPKTQRGDSELTEAPNESVLQPNVPITKPVKEKEIIEKTDRTPASTPVVVWVAGGVGLAVGLAISSTIYWNRRKH